MGLGRCRHPNGRLRAGRAAVRAADGRAAVRPDAAAERRRARRCVRIIREDDPERPSTRRGHRTRTHGEIATHRGGRIRRGSIGQLAWRPRLDRDEVPGEGAHSPLRDRRRPGDRPRPPPLGRARWRRRRRRARSTGCGSSFVRHRCRRGGGIASLAMALRARLDRHVHRNGQGHARVRTLRRSGGAARSTRPRAQSDRARATSSSRLIDFQQGPCWQRRWMFDTMGARSARRDIVERRRESPLRSGGIETRRRSSSGLRGAGAWRWKASISLSVGQAVAGGANFFELRRCIGDRRSRFEDQPLVQAQLLLVRRAACSRRWTWSIFDQAEPQGGARPGDPPARAGRRRIP